MTATEAPAAPPAETAGEGGTPLRRPADDNASLPPRENSNSNAPTTTTTTTTSSSSSVLASASLKFSDLINNNLIAARYVTMTSVGLLAAYGVAHTPAFFRYQTVSQLPSHFFGKRRTISCRIIKTLPSSSNGGVMCQLRHLSPVERLVSKATFDWWMKFHPAAAVTGTRPDESDRELLTVQIAGLEAAPLTSDYSVGSSSREQQQQQQQQPGYWLEQLARNGTRVRCTLLARKVFYQDEDTTLKSKTTTTTGASIAAPRLNKRPLSDITINTDNTDSSEWNSSTTTIGPDLDEVEQVAVVKLYYRPELFQFWATDIAESMVRQGRATVGQDLYHVENEEESASTNNDDAPKSKLLDVATDVRILQKDAAYLERLAMLEYRAAAGAYGLWGDPVVRQRKTDIVAEAEFQSTAPLWRKVLRWIRGG